MYYPFLVTLTQKSTPSPLTIGRTVQNEVGITLEVKKQTDCHPSSPHDPHDSTVLHSWYCLCLGQSFTRRWPWLIKTGVTIAGNLVRSLPTSRTYFIVDSVASNGCSSFCAATRPLRDVRSSEDESVASRKRGSLPCSWTLCSPRALGCDKGQLYNSFVSGGRCPNAHLCKRTAFQSRVHIAHLVYYVQKSMMQNRY